MAPEEETIRNPIALIMCRSCSIQTLKLCGIPFVVANQFSVHKSTVKMSVYIVCKGMVNWPIRDLMRMPGEEEASEIACDVDAK